MRHPERARVDNQLEARRLRRRDVRCRSGRRDAGRDFVGPRTVEVEDRHLGRTGLGERERDGRPGAADADDERPPARRVLAARAQARDEPDAVHGVARPLAAVVEADHVHRADQRRALRQRADVLERGGLVRDRHDQPEEVAERLRALEERAEPGRVDLHRDADGVDAVQPEERAPDLRRARLRDGVADDPEDARRAGGQAVDAQTSLAVSAYARS